ncbi:uncharacterized protein BT62DRAFT_1009319 [Guyanagaster necrorhizus]|uniref:Uncharacterized protein n=1 Tax=Guyanagaster necrorhizus TaxID=856835 RepID=A0A9P7VP99_9AGAR|nr:uncharacterized protein BT62DRAFT_1009319 [Guyanagaster necrorhizus MCA 3950]KAG7443504.1 hypothetical protein BT62DRAFT_1009319 [Guyanagaster necrorhizus MCA 3950]
MNCRRGPRKFEVIGDLDNIAKYTTGMPRPRTDLLSLDGHDDNVDFRSSIFRRQGSHKFSHVQVMSARWIVFMINGKVKCVFYVMPMDEVGLREVYGVSRDEYSYRSAWLRTKGWDLATMKQANASSYTGSGGTRASLEQAHANMREFAEGTLAELVWMEKQRFKGGQMLSIETYCWMYLGIMQEGESGRLRYFVHGIRRDAFIEMFLSELEEGIFQYLSNEILEVFSE